MLPKCAAAVFSGDCSDQASGRVYKDQLATELTLGNSQRTPVADWSLEGLHARTRRLNHRRSFHVLLNVRRRGTEHCR